MDKRITVSLPLNLQPEEFPLFDPYRTYDLGSQKVKKLKNVFVTNSGFCINNHGLIKESHHNHPHQINDYQSEAAHFYYDAIDHPENLLTLDNSHTYLAIHHPWFNYYHWICESIFRLWLVRRQLDSLTLILPEHYKEADFITGSLEPFKIENIFYVPYPKNLMVKSLCLPQLKPVCDSYNSYHLKQVSRFYRNYVFNERKIIVDKPEKLYVSRELANRRKVINEDAIRVILNRYGFSIFHPENFTFLEQVAIFSKVKYLVGEHGSGLTNLLFMAKDSSLLELHKNNTNDLDHPSPLFWYMAEALGINYYHQSCETYGKEDYFDGHYMVNTDLFEKNLIKMLN